MKLDANLFLCPQTAIVRAKAHVNGIQDSFPGRIPDLEARRGQIRGRGHSGGTQFRIIPEVIRTLASDLPAA